MFRPLRAGRSSSEQRGEIPSSWGKVSSPFSGSLHHFGKAKKPYRCLNSYSVRRATIRGQCWASELLSWVFYSSSMHNSCPIFQELFQKEENLGKDGSARQTNTTKSFSLCNYSMFDTNEASQGCAVQQQSQDIRVQWGCCSSSFLPSLNEIKGLGFILL